MSFDISVSENYRESYFKHLVSIRGGWYIDYIEKDLNSAYTFFSKKNNLLNSYGLSRCLIQMAEDAKKEENKDSSSEDFIIQANNALLQIRDYVLLNENDPLVLYIAGNYYRLGLCNTKKNMDKAILCYKKSAEMNFIPSKYQYAVCLLGNNDSISFQLFKESSKYFPVANKFIAYMYYSGKGAKQSLENALDVLSHYAIFDKASANKMILLIARDLKENGHEDISYKLFKNLIQDSWQNLSPQECVSTANYYSNINRSREDNAIIICALTAAAKHMYLPAIKMLVDEYYYGIHCRKDLYQCLYFLNLIRRVEKTYKEDFFDKVLMEYEQNCLEENNDFN